MLLCAVVRFCLLPNPSCVELLLDGTSHFLIARLRQEKSSCIVSVHSSIKRNQYIHTNTHGHCSTQTERGTEARPDCNVVMFLWLLRVSLLEWSNVMRNWSVVNVERITQGEASGSCTLLRDILCDSNSKVTRRDTGSEWQLRKKRFDANTLERWQNAAVIQSSCPHRVASHLEKY